MGKFHDQETQIVDPAIHGNLGKEDALLETDNSAVALLEGSADGQAKGAPRRFHAAQSEQFRLHLRKHKRRQKTGRAFKITAVLVFFTIAFAISGYYARRIYYLQRTDNQLGKVELTLRVAPAQEFSRTIDLKGYTSDLSTRFVAVNMAAQKQRITETRKVNRKLVSDTGTKRRKGKKRKGKPGVIVANKKKTPKPKKKSKGDLNKLLRDTGF